MTFSVKKRADTIRPFVHSSYMTFKKQAIVVEYLFRLFFMSDENALENPIRLMKEINAIKHKLQQLEREVHQVVVYQIDRIQELESLANPYSDSGHFIGDTCEEINDFDE